MEIISTSEHKNNIEYLFKASAWEIFPHLAIRYWWLPQSRSGDGPVLRSALAVGKTGKSASLSFYIHVRQRGWRQSSQLQSISRRPLRCSWARQRPTAERTTVDLLSGEFQELCWDQSAVFTTIPRIPASAAAWSLMFSVLLSNVKAKIETLEGKTRYMVLWSEKLSTVTKEVVSGWFLLLCCVYVVRTLPDVHLDRNVRAHCSDAGESDWSRRIFQLMCVEVSPVNTPTCFSLLQSDQHKQLGGLHSNTDTNINSHYGAGSDPIQTTVLFLKCFQEHMWDCLMEDDIECFQARSSFQQWNTCFITDSLKNK